MGKIFRRMAIMLCAMLIMSISLILLLVSATDADTIILPVLYLVIFMCSVIVFLASWDKLFE